MSKDGERAGSPDSSCECTACTVDIKCCRECEVTAEESGIRCSECHYWYHYLCSGLKITTIMLYEFDVDASWMCLSCFKKDDPDYDERYDKIKGEIAKEKVLIAQARSALNTAPNKKKAKSDKPVIPAKTNSAKVDSALVNAAKESDSAVTGNNSNTIANSNNNAAIGNSSKFKTKQCRYYMYNKCNKKDEECLFIHPPTCKKALAKKPCHSTKCELFHFRHEIVRTGSQQNRKGNPNINGQPSKQGKPSKNGNQGHKSKKSQSSNKRSDFLDRLQDAIKSLQRLALNI